MAFPGYLSFDETQQLIQAATDSQLVFGNRMSLFQDIRLSFVGTLQKDLPPGEQFRSDLNRLNLTERLEDNTVPLVLYLRNAAAITRDLPEGKVFENFRSVVENRSKGLRNLPQPSQLPEIVKKEAIIHQDDMVDIVFLQRALETAKSVARIEVPRFEGGVQRITNGVPYAFRGTAWLLAPKLVITNHHVINVRRDNEGTAPAADFERQACEASLAFDYDREDSTAVDPGIQAMELANEGLDYCILRLKNPPGRPPLALAAAKIEIKATSYIPVNVIQHPDGKTKKWAIRNNLAAAADDETVRYYTDTDQGSSGAPVLDDRWRVVALHRGAVFVRATQFQGKDTAYVNFGSQISRILTDVNQRKPALHDEIVNA